MKISNELKVGLTILAAIIVGFLGYRLMGDLPLLRQSKVIGTTFEQTGGLTAGSYVYINGVKVGSVKSLRLTDQDSVNVKMSFDLGVKIPQDSEAHLQSSGLLDEKEIVIQRGKSTEYLEHGDYIKGVYEGGMLETFKKEGQQLSQDVSESFEKLNALLADLNSTFDEENQEKVDQSLTNLQQSTDEIATLLRRRRAELEQSITHAQRFLANMDTVSTENSARIDSVMAGLDRSVEEFEVLSRELGETNDQLRQVLTKINKGQGSLGKLVNDPALYENLESLSGEMSKLVKNINEDPGKYLKHMRLIEVF